jgi:hypothetical protein
VSVIRMRPSLFVCTAARPQAVAGASYGGELCFS